MYISKIYLRNVRAIKELTLPVAGDTLSVRSLIIGGNSTGKSSLLRAIAIGLCTEDQGAALLAELPGRFAGPHGKDATIKIWLRPFKDESKEVSLEVHIVPHFEKRSGAFVEERVQDRQIDGPGKEDFEQSSVFVCGYGASRSLDAIGGYARYLLVDAVYTLFRYDSELQNPELTLHRLKEFYSRIYPITLRRLREILRLDKRHKFELKKTGVVVSGPVFGKNIPLDAVADGYKGTFTWLCDLVAWAMLADRIDPRTGDIKGIVLIDEIEQHIHPSWQAELINYLRKVFPSLQIIATTHSPLVALSVGPKGLVVLKRKAGYVYAEENAPDIRGYSVEDLLSDPKLFDTETYSPETSRLLQRYRRLARLPKSKRTRKQNQQLDALVQKLQCVEPVMTQNDNDLARVLRKLREKYDL